MAWKVDKTGAKIASGWQPQGKDKASQEKWNEFQEQLAKGKEPSEAAKAIGKSDFKLLNDKTGQAQIRLSGSERASFFIDEKGKRIYKIQLGGHT